MTCSPVRYEGWEAINTGLGGGDSGALAWAMRGSCVPCGTSIQAEAVVTAAMSMAGMAIQAEQSAGWGIFAVHCSWLVAQAWA